MVLEILLSRGNSVKKTFVVMSVSVIKVKVWVEITAQPITLIICVISFPCGIGLKI